jgi:hypothetical protein
MFTISIKIPRIDASKCLGSSFSNTQDESGLWLPLSVIILTKVFESRNRSCVSNHAKLDYGGPANLKLGI